MNVDAMIKHHQAVTEVITHAMSDYASAATGTSWNKACFAFEADAILCALSRAGFRILGPDEIDGPTGWQPIETAPTPPARFRVNGLCADHDKLTWFVEGEPTHWMPFPAEPAAIRALQEKRT